MGDDISADNDRLKVFVGGLTVNLTFADSDATVNCDLLRLTLLVSTSAQIPVPGSVFISCDRMVKLRGSDPRTVSN